MAELDLQSADGSAGRFRLQGGKLVIGRADDNDVVVLDGRLSRHHAEIEQRRDGYYVRDLSSMNGTFVNGRRVYGDLKLRDGDRISLGVSSLVFLDPSGGVGEPDEPVIPGAQSFSITQLSLRSTNRNIELHRQTRIIQLLGRASASLLGNRPLPELFERVLDVIFEAVPVHRGAIALLDPGTGELTVRAARSRAGEPVRSISSAIARRIVQQRVALLIPVIDEDLDLRVRESIIADGICSALCAPLWLAAPSGQGNEVIGIIYADSVNPSQRFSEEDLEILTAFANVAASKIETTRLAEANREKERLEGEMRTAAEIQRNILPRNAPLIPGCELAGESRSCLAVGGDYHEFLWDGSELSFVVADVSGKGLGAAMLMTALRAAVHAHWNEPSLASAVARINRTFFANVPLDRFATCFFARFNPSSGALTYVNAGHPPPLLMRAGGGAPVPLDEGGPGLGLLDPAEYRCGEATLTPGDTLFAYSDGVSESFSSHVEAERRLTELAVRHAAAPADQLLAAVFAAVEAERGGGLDDDCTLVVLRWSPGPPVAAGRRPHSAPTLRSLKRIAG